jgi:citrate lyase subunit beta/citryl-CoA lyase
MTLGDLAAVMPGRPDGIVLPKCAGAADVNRLSLYLDAFEAAAGIEHGATRIVTVATETARAVLKLLDFENMSPRLWGMMWGAEDLAASLGASRNRTAGRFHGPFLLARDLCLISAAAAGVVAIDTIATDINDLDALAKSLSLRVRTVSSPRRSSIPSMSTSSMPPSCRRTRKSPGRRRWSRPSTTIRLQAW